MDASKPVDLTGVNATTTAERRLRDTLRTAGLRVTRPRLLVYETLREMGGHRSVDEIVAGLTARGTSLPRMTVYNVVSDLSSVGAVMRADAGPGSALYEVSATHHHHFVCRRCGTIVDVPASADNEPCLDSDVAEAAGVVVDEAQVIFRGVCNRCGGK